MDQNELSNLEEINNQQTNNSGQNANRLMGMAAIFISILSMIAVIYQSYLAREENELIRIQQSATVLPYLDYWYSNVDKEYIFVLENKGVGPAFIKEAKFIGLDSKSKDSLFFSSSHKFYDFLEQESGYLDSLPVVLGSLHANMLLSPGERKEFITFSFDNGDQQKRITKEFNAIFAGLNIVYEDVYGTAWALDSNNGFPEKLEDD